MYRSIILIIFTTIAAGSVAAQTIGARIKDLKYHPVPSVLEFKHLVCPADHTDSLYCAFRDLKTGESVVYDIKNNLYLYPQFADSITLVAFNIYSDKGVLLAYWAFISPVANFHFIKFNHQTRNERKRVLIGCMKGRKCRYHGFDKILFSNPTMEKTQEEFDRTVREIVQDRRIDRIPKRQ